MAKKQKHFWGEAMNTNPVADFLNNSILSITGKKSKFLSKLLHRLHSTGENNTSESSDSEFIGRHVSVKPQSMLRVVKNVEQPNFAFCENPLAQKKLSRVPGLYGCNRWKSNRNKVEQEEFKIF
ncbi:hypothetical protein [Vibrio metschnikovii]|uniref:Uncharacterized protein n=1 Tax=Vibrio metschnikovii TaxID=28172 RepID=A0A9X0UPJ2_VIBME|nr:hypothetical protein [Vibrio metschnikovii]MBC5853068.1 hypothetical protein [Vibrio metschnikovii]